MVDGVTVLDVFVNRSSFKFEMIEEKLKKYLLCKMAPVSVFVILYLIQICSAWEMFEAPLDF